MSTDYGFGCETCGLDRESGRILEMVIIENYREPEVLVKLLATPRFLGSAAIVRTLGLRVRSHFDYHYDFDEAIAFAVEHYARGHIVRVCNQYGRWLDQCFGDVRCEHCDRVSPCVLPSGHEGPHKTEAPK
jgi:hypothetical protein